MGDLERELSAQLQDARARTLEWFEDLPQDKLIGPKLPIVNPPLWEVGHVAWFQERWVLGRAFGRPPMREGGAALYDSSAVHHELRWSLPLPARDATLAYLAQVQGALLEALAARALTPEQAYFVRLAIAHEDMHVEALTYTRQTLSYPPPSRAESPPAGPLEGDVDVPGGTFLLGGSRSEPFVHDNEKWAHPVEVKPFRIARAAVTQAEFAAFVQDGGYRNPELWSQAGWRRRSALGAEHPLHWKRDDGKWMRRDFDALVPLEPDRPVVHVSWYEADAYCRWAKRRLPAEAEWEAAACGEAGAGGLAQRKRRFPWGDAAPTPERANLGLGAMGCMDVAAYPEGDSAFGCRQMIGNVWEWTASDFAPYPGFSVDPYEDFSKPWFGTHKVLRGGCWATQPRLIRGTWRSFYMPDRRDVWAGFRTCAA